MERINHSTAVDIGGGRNGFRSKDTLAGVPGTVVTATHLNAQQEEIVGFIEKTGQAPSGANVSQMAIGIRSQAMNYRVAGGTANALTITLDPVPASWAALNGTPFQIRISVNNSAAATLAVTGLPGTKGLRTLAGATLAGGDLLAGAIMSFVYDQASDTVLVTNLQKGVGPFAIGAIYSITASQTWNRPAGCRAVLIEGLAGGGAGGGSGNAAVGELSQGAGGGSGGYFRKLIIGPDASYAATIGAGGVGVIGGNGGSGGATSWGAVCSAVGGGGGSLLTSGTSSNGSANGAGGAGSGGDIVGAGTPGQRGVRFSGSNGFGGSGGSSIYGGGGFGAGTSSPGGAASGFGAGGGGSLAVSANGFKGGDGSPGIINVWEFY